MILVLDNYDSFTYNLVQYLGELGAELQVYRNDEISVAQIMERDPRGIVISPGPGRPEDAGISVPLIEFVAGKKPVLGVCLGHQALGMAFGGKVGPAPTLMHGKTSKVHHEQNALFVQVSNPFEATRYHSLIVERDSLPRVLKITAESDDGVIMAMQHESLPLYGVQFHPESILTSEGKQILKNFLNICAEK